MAAAPAPAATQIHLALGKDPTSVTVSWVSPSVKDPSTVQFGLSATSLKSTATGPAAKTYTLTAVPRNTTAGERATAPPAV